MEAADIYMAGEPAGTLDRIEGGALRFSYHPGYDGIPLSASMPADGPRTYTGRRVGAWFAGLLPDDPAVRAGLAAEAECRPNDIIGLLSAYGGDLAGAVQAAPAGNPLGEGSYRPADRAELGAAIDRIRASEAAGTDRTWTGPGERWMLAGNQAKIAVAGAEAGGYARCLGGAPSTAIIKPGIYGYGSQALCEAFCQQLAFAAGIPAAPARMERLAGTDALVSRRYDRMRSADGTTARFHQEDLCQLAGCMPSGKYPQEGGPSASAAAKMILEVCGEEDAYSFAAALAFNYAIGATDAHAKNYSILYGADGKPHLAPLYDAASILPYIEPKERYRTAMAIGGEARFGRVSRRDAARFAEAAGLDPDETARIFAETAEAAADAVPTTAAMFSGARDPDGILEVLPGRIERLAEAVRATMCSEHGHGATYTDLAAFLCGREARTAAKPLHGAVAAGTRSR